MDAYTFAVEKLKKITIEEIAKNSGCRYLEQQNMLIVPYLNTECFLKLPDFSFVQDENLKTKEKVLILHYLAQSKNIHEDGILISFSELEAGNIYKPSIESRIYKPLTDRFRLSGETFLKNASSLGATKTQHSKYSVRLNVFPKVSIYIIFYPEDDEFPASCQMLFDSSIKNILDTEDIVVICEEITEKLISL